MKKTFIFHPSSLILFSPASTTCNTGAPSPTWPSAPARTDTPTATAIQMLANQNLHRTILILIRSLNTVPLSPPRQPAQTNIEMICLNTC